MNTVDKGRLYRFYLKENRQSYLVSVVGFAGMAYILYWYHEWFSLLVGTWVVPALLALNFLIFMGALSSIGRDDIESDLDGLSYSQARSFHEVKSFLDGLFKEDVHIVVKKSDDMNAGITGLRHRIVLITTGMLEKMPIANIKGVMVHEYGHYVNNDLYFTFLAQSILKVIGGMQITAFLLMCFNWYNSTPVIMNDVVYTKFEAYYLIWWTSFILTFVAGVMNMMISREREQMADVLTIMHGLGHELVGAFEILMTQQSDTQRFFSRYFFMFFSHPALWMRHRDLSMMLAGDEGIVPDWLETTFAYAFVVGMWFWGLLHLSDHQVVPSIGGVPYLYLLALPFGYMLFGMLANGSAEHPEMEKFKGRPGIAVFGGVYFLAVYILGLLCWHWVDQSNVVSESFSTLVLVFWATIPVTGLLGRMSNFFRLWTHVFCWIVLANCLIGVWSLMN